jgi:hypothetical protein
MPYPSTSLQATNTKTALRPFSGMATRRAGGLQPSSIPLYTQRRTPMPYSSSLQGMGWPAARQLQTLHWLCVSNSILSQIDDI